MKYLQAFSESQTDKFIGFKQLFLIFFKKIVHCSKDYSKFIVQRIKYLYMKSIFTFIQPLSSRILLLLFVAVASNLKAQDLYDINTIQTIRITFSQSNWDYMLDTATTGSDGYIMAQSVEINGVVFDSVGVKYKGNSTYNANQAKNPFHIELDTYKNQNYGGYSDLKLSNVAKDPSFVREVLGYQILRQYMHAPCPIMRMFMSMAT